MKEYDIYLFDLDGTLTDSGPGIMHSFAYATGKMGNEITDPALLRRFVGPPLEESFEKILGYSTEDVQKGITYYREYYFGQGGALENIVYPGIPELLANLKSKRKKLIVATSKSEKGTNLVLDHFDLRKYFDLVASANDTDRKTKVQVLTYAFETCHITDRKKAVMIGDRHYDMIGAREKGIDSIGVLWGYGSREELEQAGATCRVEKPEEISEI